MKSLWRVFSWFLGALTACAAPARPDTTGNDLFVERVVPRLQIEIPKDGMKVLRSYHYVWRQARPERIDVPVIVREGAQVYTNVALHLKGSFTFEPIDERPSLTLNFDKFAKGQRFHGLGKIHLNNTVQDPTFLCEAVARDFFNDIGVPTPRAGHAVLTLNGRKLGLYVLLEGANKQFLRRHFKSTHGNLYDGGAEGEITDPLPVDCGDDPDDRSSLSNLVTAAREPDPDQRFKRLDQVLDVDRFVSFVAGEVLLVQWDGYSTGKPNNYRVFHDASRNKMVFMPHGLDQILVPVPEAHTITPHFNGLVARALITTPEGRRRYLARVDSLATNEFSLRALSARVDALAQKLQVAIGGEPRTGVDVPEGARSLKERIEERIKIVLKRVQEPMQPVSFDADNSARPKSWHFKTSFAQPASARVIEDKGRKILQVSSRAPGVAGSWRAQLLLPQGHYAFSGNIRTEGISAAQLHGTNGVALRVSGERAATGVASTAWTNLTYEFEVRGIEDVELVCELRGKGSAFIDPSTFRVVRMEK